MDNKKVLGISIAAVIVLVVAIVATSYAAFTADITGTKENTINTGYVTLNCTEATFGVSDTQPMTDAQGIAANNNAYTCTLQSTMVGTMNVGYDVALTDVDTATPSDTIGTGNVKIQAKKSIDSGTDAYLANTTSSAGVLISSLSDAAGTYDSTITAYKLDSATISGNHSVLYTIKAWVASEGAASNTSTSNTTGICSDTTYVTETTCEDAGEIWGTSQTQTQAGGTFSFKVKIGATQTGV